MIGDRSVIISDRVIHERPGLLESIGRGSIVGDHMPHPTCECDQCKEHYDTKAVEMGINSDVPSGVALHLLEPGKTMYTPDPKVLATLANNFSYHAPINGQKERYEKIRATAADFAHLLVTNCPASRELSLALTHLENVVYTANAAIARNEKEPVTE